ncbi:MAG: hypothetical protein ACI9VT_000524 [Psychroserpens sp.]|jgi:hypothetical protein
MATIAEQGSIQPTIITSGIIFVLIIWSLYAFSAAGVIIQLPFVRVILVIITAIYLLRGVAGLLLVNNPLDHCDNTYYWLKAGVVIVCLKEKIGIINSIVIVKLVQDLMSILFDI